MKYPVGDFSVHDEEVIKPFLKKLGKGLYLEIGVKHGRSLAIAKYYAPEATICGIDISDENYDYKYFENIDVTFIHKSANDVVWDKPIDLLFIDGDHSQEQVEKDIKNFAKWVRKGGYILFHDFDITSPGVIIAVDDFVLKNNLTMDFYRFSKPGLVTSMLGVRV